MGGNITAEEPGKHYLSQVIKFNIISYVILLACILDMMMTSFISVIFLPRTCNSSLIIRKIYINSTNYMNTTSQNCLGHQKIRIVWETVTDQRRLKET